MRPTRTAGVLTVVGVALALSAPLAEAQTSSYHSATDSVTINWGALDGATAQPSAPAATYGAPQVGRGGLLVPPPTTPKSKLLVTPPAGSDRVTLRPPSEAPASVPAEKPATATASAPPKPEMPKAAEPAPAPKVAEAPSAPAKMAPPAPKAPAPAPKTAAALPPPPAPTETASSAPPPPPPVDAPAASAPPPAPNVTAAPSAPEKPTEQASAPVAAPAGDGGPWQVLFNGDDTKLSADGQGVLSGVVEKLGADEKQRVQLLAYAAGDDLTSSKARRISLSRALSVRSFLIEKGIRSTRIDVRALGDKAENDPKNRVDVNVVTR